MSVVDVNIFKRRVENVAEDAHHSVLLFEYKFRRLRALRFGASVFECLYESFEFVVQLGYFFTFGGGTDNDAEVFRLDTFDQLSQTQFLLG